MSRGFGIRNSGFGKALRRSGYILAAGACLFLNPGSRILNAASAQAVTTDSRIKTFIYNPNEVFAITTHYGYQSNIEFGPKEEIDTISVGDRVAWQITPSGRRLFIRALEENARTNMTVVTNFRAYQFDLRSSTADAVFGSEELTYVVRFFYPSSTISDKETPMPANLSRPLASAPMAPARPVAIAPEPTLPSTAIRSAPLAPPTQPNTAMTRPIAASGNAAPGAVNYRYTFSGPSDIAPTKIYDDGKTTYFKLRSNQNPKVAIVTAQGDTVPVNARRTADGLLAVDAIAPRFSLDQSKGRVIVYNEAGEV